jgi:hypothetical protein
VAEESDSFIRGGLITDADFLTAIEHNLGVNKAVSDAIVKKMPSPAVSNGKFKSQRQRIVDFIQFSAFTCNVRFLSEAYKGKTYNAQYSRGDGSHGSDILPLFYNDDNPLFRAYSLADPIISTFAPQYHSYYTSHTRTGDVNTYRINGTIQWPKAKFGPSISNVLNIRDKDYELIEDTRTTAEDCDFWKDVFAALTISAGILKSDLCEISSINGPLGYSPPDAVVPSSILGNDTTGASRNYLRPQNH